MGEKDTQKRVEWNWPEQRCSKFKKAVMRGSACGLALIAINIMAACGAGRTVKDVEYTNNAGYAGTYSGEWKDGKPNGNGAFRFENGIYEGEWLDGSWNGYGTLKWDDGTVYEGQWKGGVKDGQATETWSDGAVYVGEYKDGKFDGQGRLAYADGAVYEGQWKDGEYNGQGTKTSADGSDYAGEWIDGFMVNRWIDAGQVDIDYNTTHGSEYSYCISTEQGNAFSLVKNYPVKPNTYYTASAYVKTEDLVNVERGDIGANISADVPRNDSNEGWSISANLVGDHDWTKLSLLLYSGDASEIKVSFN